MTFDEASRAIRPVSASHAAAARQRHDQLTKPPGSLGVLETLGIRLAAIYGSERPPITGKAVAVFAADHGVTAAGVSAFPKAVTEQMVLNFLSGGAAVNALSSANGFELVVVDVGVDADLPARAGLLAKKVARGSQNMLEAPAMTSNDLAAALQVGVDVAEQLVAGGANLLIGGDMGIGNTTAAAAITAVMTGQPVATVTGRGTGIDDARLRHKIEVIETAIQRHSVSAAEPLELLAKLGGLEIAALVGFYTGAAANGCALILDGFIVSSAALVAAALTSDIKDYFFASHSSEEPGHAVQLAALGLGPLLDFGMRLGEGTGALVASSILVSAAAVLSDMATFAEAGVDSGG